VHSAARVGLGLGRERPGIRDRAIGRSAAEVADAAGEARVVEVVPGWTIQQLRETIPRDHGNRCLIHYRDATFSWDVDDAVKAMRIRPLRKPVRAPQANSFCERLIGTIRRDCFDCLIPLSERLLRRIPTPWKNHYNRGRSLMALGPGILDEGSAPPELPRTTRHQILDGYPVVAEPVLGGLHHEYRSQSPI